MNVKVTMKIKKMREERGMSIRQLASISGVSRSHISRLENNVSMPKICILCMLAIALGVGPEELYSYEIVKK